MGSPVCFVSYVQICLRDVLEPVISEVLQLRHGAHNNRLLLLGNTLHLKAGSLDSFVRLTLEDNHFAPYLHMHAKSHSETIRLVNHSLTVLLVVTTQT